MTPCARFPKSIIFDVGGILVHPSGIAMARAIFSRTGHSVDPDLCALSLYLASAWAHEYELPEDTPRVLQHWADYLGIPAEDGQEAWRAYRAADDTLWTEIDSAAFDVLEDLTGQGITLGVLSNANGGLAESLQRKGLAKYFEVIVDSGVVGVAKPDPSAYLLCTGLLGIESSDCWFVGDSPIEVAAARNMTFGASIYCSPLCARIELNSSRCEIPSLSDLPVVLEAVRK
ncbi:HAD family hydrolase [Nocardia aurea]|uniref:HAD family hydrolase n=1 Tax=Nocardia aurea TaxID=2144174 RepID=UPI000D68D58A|nr:HAD-IA family hydrolase [Nocardia aurea]